MDHAFASGDTAQDRRLRKMFNARKNTALDEPSSVTSIRDFFRSMKFNNISADDLVICSHASDEGFLMIALDDIHTNLPINFEDLEAVDSSGSIHIPAGVGGSKTRVHFKGCNIGRDDTLPFLKVPSRAFSARTNAVLLEQICGLAQNPPIVVGDCTLCLLERSLVPAKTEIRG